MWKTASRGVQAEQVLRQCVDTTGLSVRLYEMAARPPTSQAGCEFHDSGQVTFHNTTLMDLYTHVYGRIDRIAKRTVFWLPLTC